MTRGQHWRLLKELATNNAHHGILCVPPLPEEIVGIVWEVDTICWATSGWKR